MNKGSEKVAKQIGFAMLGGIIFGLLLYVTGYSEYAGYLKPIGTVFIRLLKMVIIPLVFSSIYMAMLNLGTPEELGNMGKKALGYYFFTTAIAVLFGLIVVNIFQPGKGLDLATLGNTTLPEDLTLKLSSQQGLFQTILGVLIDAVPTNPFASMAQSTILQVIVFAILMGMVGVHYKEKSSGVTNFMRSLEFMSMTLTHWIMKLAPVGVFVLMLDVIATSGFTAIMTLAKYMFVVLIGLFGHWLALLFWGAYRLKKSPIFVIKGLAAPLMTAFSTASSAATLPITMASVEENLGVNKKTAEFVLPLGATVNMDGTALYESVAVLFIAQTYGIELTLAQQMVVFLTASLAAVGAAAIPGAGLITMSIVLGAVGLPLEGIGLILAVDRILDMFRTAVNVFGDCVGTITVDSYSRQK